MYCQDNITLKKLEVKKLSRQYRPYVDGNLQIRLPFGCEIRGRILVLSWTRFKKSFSKF